METTTESSIVTPSPSLSRKRGRPPMAVDATKLSSLFAALGSSDSKGRTMSYLQQVSGLLRVEVKSIVRSMLKAGKLKQLGTKKGSSYILV